MVFHIEGNIINIKIDKDKNRKFTYGMCEKSKIVISYVSQSDIRQQSYCILQGEKLKIFVKIKLTSDIPVKLSHLP